MPKYFAKFVSLIPVNDYIIIKADNEDDAVVMARQHIAYQKEQDLETEAYRLISLEEK